jgi:hypothetical protein
MKNCMWYHESDFLFIMRAFIFIFHSDFLLYAVLKYYVHAYNKSISRIKYMEISMVGDTRQNNIPFPRTICLAKSDLIRKWDKLEVKKYD